MPIAVVTGWSPSGYEKYGRDFAQRFAKYWPTDIKLTAYVETFAILPRGVCVGLWEIPGATEFMLRTKGVAARCGAAPGPSWKPKEIANGYSYRFDAFKFFRQCVIPWDAAFAMHDGDILVWLDADVVTFDKIPKGFIEKQLGDADLCYLGREPKHSEIGFWAVRLNARSRDFLSDFAEMYLNDKVFALSQWHSAFVFDHCRRESQKNGLIARDLTPGGSGHVWFQSELGQYTDHCKGDRKGRGSKECPTKWWLRT